MISISRPTSMSGRWLRAGLVLLAAAVLSGCAMAPLMPLSEDTAKVEADKPLYLMTVTLRNEYRERYQPSPLNIVFADAKAVRKVGFRMDEKGKPAPAAEGGPQTFLVRFTAADDVETVSGMTAMASAFPVHGFYFVPLHLKLPKAGPGVHYLGAVKAVIRERKDTEFRAGPVMPLIDQAVAGASGGTFDITIEDAFAADAELFRKTFPALADMPIEKQVLPSWDRTRAQTEWEKE